MKCRKCGAELTEGVLFCWKCGTKAEMQKRFCHECGTELVPGAKFCVKCGASVVLPDEVEEPNITEELTLSKSEVFDLEEEPEVTEPASDSVLEQQENRPIESFADMEKKDNNKKSILDFLKIGGIAFVVILAIVGLIVTVIGKTKQPERNGFNSSTNELYKMGSYSIEVPSYWQNEDIYYDNIQFYAESEETEVSLILTLVSIEEATDLESSDDLIAQKDEYAKSLEGSIFDKVTGCEVIDTGTVKGVLFEGELDETAGKLYGGKWFMFISDEDETIYNVIFFYESNPKYSYSKDFKKIIYSIKPR
ncbi:MAG: zinc ribbon domain-containing protein [Erysipelotrichaceae bacterium]|nr:zinc ribbon domain-containing protein [Erysipelotrichaceae bacterium]